MVFYVVRQEKDLSFFQFSFFLSLFFPFLFFFFNIISQVNNFGLNALKLSRCDKSIDIDRVSKFGIVDVPRCSEDELEVCPSLVHPSSFSALLLPPSTTYVKLEFCVPPEEGLQVSEMVDGLISEREGSGVDDVKCLADPKPQYYYGSSFLWPSSIDIDFADALFCDSVSLSFSFFIFFFPSFLIFLFFLISFLLLKDDDCTASTCDKRHSPPICDVNSDFSSHL